MELDTEWLITRLEHGHCEMTGLPFVLDSPTDCAIHPFTPSVDKIVPALGYTKENCRVVVFAVNAAKQDWSDDTLLAVADAIHSNSKYFTGKQMQDDTDTTTAVAVITANAVVPSPTVKPVFTAVEKLVRVLGSADLSAISEVCGVNPNDVLDVLDNNRDFLTIQNGRITALFLPDKSRHLVYHQESIPNPDPNVPQVDGRPQRLFVPVWKTYKEAERVAEVLDMQNSLKEFHGHRNFENVSLVYLPNMSEADMNAAGFFQSEEDALAHHWKE